MNTLGVEAKLAQKYGYSDIDTTLQNDYEVI